MTENVTTTKEMYDLIDHVAHQMARFEVRYWPTMVARFLQTVEAESIDIETETIDAALQKIVTRIIERLTQGWW